jgi:hypothetical protein
MNVAFDATPWFTEADSQSITQLAQRGWSSPWVADALQHRPGYEHLRELIEYATARLEEESLEDPTWSAFECVVSGPDAMAWLYEHRPDIAAKMASKLNDSRLKGGDVGPVARSSV